LMRRPGIHRFVVVAPPANLMDFGFLAPCPASGLIIQGDQDDIVPEPDVARLVDTLSRQPDIHVEYQVIPGADHFFGDRMDDLIRSVKDYVSRTLPGPAT